MVIDERSLLVLISVHETFVMFSVPCPAEEGSDEVALVDAWHSARITPTMLHRHHLQNDQGRQWRLIMLWFDLFRLTWSFYCCKICRWLAGNLALTSNVFSHWLCALCFSLCQGKDSVPVPFQHSEMSEGFFQSPVDLHLSWSLLLSVDWKSFCPSTDGCCSTASSAKHSCAGKVALEQTEAVCLSCCHRGCLSSCPGLLLRLLVLLCVQAGHAHSPTVL